MSISPTVEIIIVATCLLSYGIGNYVNFRAGEFLKLIGVGGIGLVILNLFLTSCPARVLPSLLWIVLIVLVIQLVTWVYFRYFSYNNQ